MYPIQKLLKLNSKQQCKQTPLNDVQKSCFKNCNQFQRPILQQNSCDQSLIVQQKNNDTKIKSDTTDFYWNNFLKAQQQTTASSLHKFQINSLGKDPTIEADKGFSEQLIQQRLNHMPVIGNLEKMDLYCLLFLLLNLKDFPATKQNQLMQHLLQQKLLDKEILLYLTIIARHSHTNLEPVEKKVFLEIFLKLMKSIESTTSWDYFNSNHIFRKTVHRIDPYEKEYLKSIMQSQLILKPDQYLYLLNFVSRLQEITAEERENYLTSLFAEKVLPFPKLHNIKEFLNQKSPKINHEKIHRLLLESAKLMNICSFTMPIAAGVEKVKPSISKILQMDKNRIKNALQSLMKAGIPNIVRVNELKNYLIELLTIDEAKQLQILESLKNSMNLTKAEVLFMYKYVIEQNLTNQPEKFKEIINQVAATPANPLKPSIIFGAMPSCELAKDFVKPESKMHVKYEKEQPKKEMPIKNDESKPTVEEKIKVQEQNSKKDKNPKKLKKEISPKNETNIQLEERTKIEEEKPKKEEKSKGAEKPKIEEKSKKEEKLKEEKKPKFEEKPRQREEPTQKESKLKTEDKENIKPIEFPPKQSSKKKQAVKDPSKTEQTKAPPLQNNKYKCPEKQEFKPNCPNDACKAACDTAAICQKASSFVLYNEPAICRRQEMPRRVHRNNCFYLCSCGKVYNNCQVHSATAQCYREKLIKLKKYCS